MSEISICLILRLLKLIEAYGFSVESITISVDGESEHIKYFSGDLESQLDMMYSRLEERPGDDYWKLVSIEAHGYEEIIQKMIKPLTWKTPMKYVSSNSDETSLRHADTLYKLIKDYLDSFAEFIKVWNSQYSPCYALPEWTVWDSFFDTDARMRGCRTKQQLFAQCNQ